MSLAAGCAVLVRVTAYWLGGVCVSLDAGWVVLVSLAVGCVVFVALVVG